MFKRFDLMLKDGGVEKASAPKVLQQFSRLRRVIAARFRLCDDLMLSRDVTFAGRQIPLGLRQMLGHGCRVHSGGFPHN
jgi:hypothetical protein